MANKPKIANKAGVVFDESGKRLYGLDAEIYQKLESKRDPQLELKLGLWLENILEEELVDRFDLWLSLKNGGKNSLIFEIKSEN